MSRLAVRLRPGRHSLPGALPAGERVLWQGAPGWRALARHALHLRALAGYLGVVVASVGVMGVVHGAPWPAIVQDTGRAALVASVPLAVGALYAWLAARAAFYTITNRRVAMRMGLGVPLTLNVPFTQIEAASLSLKADGTGDIALALLPGHKGLGWFILWPHARPWRMARPQPMLRGLTDAPEAAAILAAALTETDGVSVVVAPPTGNVDTPERQYGTTAVTA